MAIYLTFALALFNTVSVGGARVLVTLYALKLGAQPIAIGLLAATFAMFPMLLSLHAGRISDRFGTRWPLTFGAAIGGTGLLLPYFFPSLPVVFIAAALSGLSSTFYVLSLQSLIGMLSNVDNRTRNYSNYAVFVSAGNALGPVLAGIAVDRWGHSFTFLCVAAVMVAPLVLLSGWGDRLPGGRRSSAPRRGIRHMLTNPQIWPIIAASSIAQAALEVFQVYLPVYGDAQALSASAIGLIISMCAVGGFIARVNITFLIAWANEERVLAYALFLGAASFVLMPFCQSAALLAFMAFLFGFGLNCSQPIALMLIYSRSPEGRSGEALGVRFAVDNAARLVGPVIFGMIASALGVAAVFWLNALVLAMGGGITHRDAAKRERKL